MTSGHFHRLASLWSVLALVVGCNGAETTRQGGADPADAGSAVSVDGAADDAAAALGREPPLRDDGMLDAGPDVSDGTIPGELDQGSPDGGPRGQGYRLTGVHVRWIGIEQHGDTRRLEGRLGVRRVRASGPGWHLAGELKP